ncbi:MAG TPA: hypothetical protein VEF03_02900 [Candidatus Binataceae bacterium]|nr:hypothetical protein [Candidatus Binataceae bacterium]
MAQITGETVKRMARDIFDYEVSDADADSMAGTAGAMLTLARQLIGLGLDGIEPPFGYSNLFAEAAIQSKSKA